MLNDPEGSVLCFCDHRRVLSPEEVSADLWRLADPILEAFGAARAAHAALLDHLADDYARFLAPVAGVFDGVAYWALFATFLTERFELLPGVERLTGPHALAHHWSVDRDVVLQLKSDVGNLPVDQMKLDALPGIPRVAAEVVVLTWDHEHAERVDPCFVQMEGKREVWRMSVASLADPPA